MRKRPLYRLDNHQYPYNKPGIDDARQQRKTRDDLIAQLMSERADLLAICGSCCHHGIIRFNPDTDDYHCLQCNRPWLDPTADLPSYYLKS
ncbi:hypothetical protein [Photobacterium sp. R1]